MSTHRPIPGTGQCAVDTGYRRRMWVGLPEYDYREVPVYRVIDCTDHVGGSGAGSPTAMIDDYLAKQRHGPDCEQFSCECGLFDAVMALDALRSHLSEGEREPDLNFPPIPVSDGEVDAMVRSICASLFDDGRSMTEVDTERLRDLLRFRATHSVAWLEEMLCAAIEDGWMPIESAPRDGTTVIVARHMGEPWGWVLGVSRWDAPPAPTHTYPSNPAYPQEPIIEGWLSRGFPGPADGLGLAHPTHWQPLPLAPTGEGR